MTRRLMHIMFVIALLVIVTLGAWCIILRERVSLLQENQRLLKEMAAARRDESIANARIAAASMSALTTTLDGLGLSHSAMGRYSRAYMEAADGTSFGVGGW